jgi:UDPglucose--hexose-1-phosphate uridylyltransferase
MQLRSMVIDSRLVLPGESTPSTQQVEVRWDPLTGHTSRIVLGAAARLPPTELDLRELADATRPSCPFCDAYAKTPRFVDDVWPDGRIEVGSAVAFPNLLSYAAHSAVCIYGVDLHYLPLNGFTQALIADNIAAQVQFLRAVTAADPAAQWTSISANHMLPSGSSLFHPHTQATAHPFPTTMGRLLEEVSPALVDDYLDGERDGPRWLADTGSVRWLTAFAPIGSAEIRCFVPEWSSVEQLGPAVVQELASGLCAALQVYDDLGITSFNFALYGSPTPGHPLSLRLVARSAVAPYYRSDATNLERLHWEAAVETRPEGLAEHARPRFAAL